MLVISRKTSEFVQIGENIVVKIIKTANGSVKIGVDAPGGMRVLRGELTGDSATSLRFPTGKDSRVYGKTRLETEVLEAAL